MGWGRRHDEGGVMVRKPFPAVLGALIALVVPAIAQEQPQLRVDLQVEKELVETSASGETTVRRLAVDSAGIRLLSDTETLGVAD